MKRIFDAACSAVITGFDAASEQTNGASGKRKEIRVVSAEENTTSDVMERLRELIFSRALILRSLFLLIFESLGFSQEEFHNYNINPFVTELIFISCITVITVLLFLQYILNELVFF